MKLVIVESPTKAKTIGKFLGKGFTVKSSFGHVRDLPKSEMGIEIENEFQPRYVIPKKSEPKILELKEGLKKSDEVILASDEDREGEAISWHLVKALGLDGKNGKPYKRIVFHEITKTAIENALKNPREIDINLFNAQQARRVLDRLVGYELSPFLWKKIRRGLSAGRVQSVAVRLIAEREREIEKFKNEKFWTIEAILSKKDGATNFESTLHEINGEKVEKSVSIELFSGKYTNKKTILNTEKKALEVKEDLEKSKLQIKNIDKKEVLRNPSAPFTTSTLQQAAISNLGWSAKQTMSVAQKIYEKGFITYMRTDSVNLSLESLMTAKKIINKEFGKEYSLESPRYYTNKSKSAQEAHEAIRPSYPEKTPTDLSKELEESEQRLYKLIWTRMIACQMQSAKMSSVKIDIEAKPARHASQGDVGGGKKEYSLKATGQSIIFDGFLKAHGPSAQKETFLPDFEIGEEIKLIEAKATGKETTPPPRYNEATLVKVMEEHSIGRPSTYAPTISTIIERKYVEKKEDKRLHPLEIGLVVNDLLVEHFPQIVDIDFTATMEESLDSVAEGKAEWVPVVRDFYEPFHQNLEDKTETVKKEDFIEKTDKKCPECGNDLILKFGRFGKFVACSKYPECKHTEKTDEEKAEDEQFSGEKCEKCGKPMAVKRGRFGPFLGCSGYPECKNIKGIEKKTGVSCPGCGKGEIIERKSKKGRLFYGCNKYPACEFSLWNKPTGENCPKCQGLLTFAAKGKITCSNKECSFVKEQ